LLGIALHHRLKFSNRVCKYDRAILY